MSTKLMLEAIGYSINRYKPKHRNAGANFGFSLFINDKYIGIGSPSEPLDENGLNSLSNSGSVDIWTYGSNS